jgi:hypothetical protein
MYRIKFLERWYSPSETVPPQPVYFEQTFGENDIPTMAQHWKAMGFKMVCEITLVGEGSGFSIPQIVDLFYAESIERNGQVFEIQLSVEDKKIKKELLEKYSPKKKVEVKDEVKTEKPKTYAQMNASERAEYQKNKKNK